MSAVAAHPVLGVARFEPAGVATRWALHEDKTRYAMQWCQVEGKAVVATDGKWLLLAEEGAGEAGDQDGLWELPRPTDRAKNVKPGEHRSKIQARRYQPEGSECFPPWRDVISAFNEPRSQVTRVQADKLLHALDAVLSLDGCSGAARWLADENSFQLIACWNAVEVRVSHGNEAWDWPKKVGLGSTLVRRAVRAFQEEKILRGKPWQCMELDLHWGKDPSTQPLVITAEESGLKALIMPLDLGA